MFVNNNYKNHYLTKMGTSNYNMSLSAMNKY